MTVESLERIIVVRQDREYIVVDGNRRLFVLKMLDERNRLGSDKIPVSFNRFTDHFELFEDEELCFSETAKKDINNLITHSM